LRAEVADLAPQRGRAGTSIHLGPVMVTLSPEHRTRRAARNKRRTRRTRADTAIKHVNSFARKSACGH
jgi:hypothetical protein